MIEHRSTGDTTGTLYRVYLYDHDRKVADIPLTFDGTTEHCWSSSLLHEAVAGLPDGTDVYVQPVLTERNYQPNGKAVWGQTPFGRFRTAATPE